MSTTYTGRAVLCALACLAAGTAFGKAQYTSFDVSGASGTYAWAINDSDVIAGYYNVGQTYHSFVRVADGTITAFDPQGAVQSYVTGIDNRSTISGVFDDSNNAEHGYLRSSKGKITQIDVPGSSCTAVLAISSGLIAGLYCGDGGGAFLRTNDGSFMTFGVPNALFTEATCIDAGGVVAGEWLDPNEGLVHGFLRATDGTITTFDAPDGISSTVVGINKAGAIAGSYLGNDFNEHGFIRAADGTFTEFDPPQSTNTVVTSIDQKGGVVGYYYDNNCGGEATACAFSRAPNGTIKTFSIKKHYTIANGVAHVPGSGMAITGWWVEDGGLHGFLRTN